MDTVVLERGRSNYIVNVARVVRTEADVSADLADAVADNSWNVDKANPFVQWIAGDFVEAENPNSNTQYWTAGDLELAEYSIKYAPLNMVHKFRQPIGFYAATKTVKLEKDAAAKLVAPQDSGSLKIQALSGLWTHIFPFESAQVEAADDAGLLFYSMECRGTHLTCGTDEAKGLTGCGQTFDYMQVDTHCEHLQERSSVRHIVNPTFRGGAIIVPPVRPGWKNAKASVLEEAVMQEAAAFAEQNERAYNQLTGDGVDLSAAAWEQLMAMTIRSTTH